MFYTTEVLLPMEVLVLHCENMDFFTILSLNAPVTLTFTR